MASKTEKTTITFRMDVDKKDALDALAESMKRDRSFLLNEAVDALLELHAWQVDHTAEAVEEAAAGKFESPEAVTAALQRMRKNLSR